MAIKKKESGEMIEVQEIHRSESRFNILGTSPMIMNRFAMKAWQELLAPQRKKNRAGLEQSLKHDPLAEFRGGLYLNSDPKTKSLVHVPNGAFHKAIAAAALDLPGVKKAQMERLTSISSMNIELYGVPQMFMAMVRNSDMNRTPDVRTRPIFPEWACTVTVRYVRSILSERTVANLLGGAGLIVGIGDWRPQKGGPNGTFQLVDDKNAAFNRIVKSQGRAAQQRAYDHPGFFDQTTEDLYTWFEAEVGRREMDSHLISKKGNGKIKGNGKMPHAPVILESKDRYVGVE